MSLALEEYYQDQDDYYNVNDTHEEEVNDLVDPICVDRKTNYTDPEHNAFQPLTLYFGLSFVPLLCLFGMTCNILSFFIFRKGASSSASHFYFCSIAVADTMTLFFAYFINVWFKEILQDFLRVVKATDTMVYQVVTAIDWKSRWCALQFFFRYSSEMISVWLLLEFTMCRTIAVLRPFAARRFATVRAARRMVAILVVIAFIINTGLSQIDRVNCMRSNLGELLDLALITAFPAVLMTVMNCIILYHSYARFWGVRKAQRGAANFAGRRGNLGIMTRRLVLVTALFVLTVTPLFIFKIVSYVFRIRHRCTPRYFDDLELMLKILTNMYYSVSCVLYCLSSSYQLKQAFFHVIRCRSPKKLSVLSHRSSHEVESLTECYCACICKKSRRKARQNVLFGSYPSPNESRRVHASSIDVPFLSDSWDEDRSSFKPSGIRMYSKYCPPLSFYESSSRQHERERMYSNGLPATYVHFPITYFVRNPKRMLKRSTSLPLTLEFCESTPVFFD